MGARGAREHPQDVELPGRVPGLPEGGTPRIAAGIHLQLEEEAVGPWVPARAGFQLAQVHAPVGEGLQHPNEGAGPVQGAEEDGGLPPPPILPGRGRRQADAAWDGPAGRYSNRAPQSAATGQKGFGKVPIRSHCPEKEAERAGEAAGRSAEEVGGSQQAVKKANKGHR